MKTLLILLAAASLTSAAWAENGTAEHTSAGTSSQGRTHSSDRANNSSTSTIGADTSSLSSATEGMGGTVETGSSSLRSATEGMGDQVESEKSSQTRANESMGDTIDTSSSSTRRATEGMGDRVESNSSLRSATEGMSDRLDTSSSSLRRANEGMSEHDGVLTSGTSSDINIDHSNFNKARYSDRNSYLNYLKSQRDSFNSHLGDLSPQDRQRFDKLSTRFDRELTRQNTISERQWNRYRNNLNNNLTDMNNVFNAQ